MYSLFNKKNWPSLSQKAFSIAHAGTTATSSITSEIAKKKQTGPRTDYSAGTPQKRMMAAIKSLEDDPEASVRQTAKKYGVNRKALTGRIKGEISFDASLGRTALLTREEEEVLTQHCIDMARLGYGYDRKQIIGLASYYLKGKGTQITRGRWQSFILRHPELSRRKAEAFDRYRTASCTKAKVQDFFDLLELAYEKCKQFSNGEALTANRI